MGCRSRARGARPAGPHRSRRVLDPAGAAVSRYHRAARPAVRRGHRPGPARDRPGPGRAGGRGHPPGAAADARPPPRDRPGLVPALGDDRLRLLRRPVRRLAGRGPRAPGLPGRARRHLSAPDAAAAAARRRDRWRLRGSGLRRGRSPSRHHGRSAGPGRRPARARHGAVRRPGAQPHRGRARMGPQGTGRRARLPRDVPHLPGPGRTRPL